MTPSRSTCCFLQKDCTHQFFLILTYFDFGYFVVLCGVPQVPFIVVVVLLSRYRLAGVTVILGICLYRVSNYYSNASRGISNYFHGQWVCMLC